MSEKLKPEEFVKCFRGIVCDPNMDILGMVRQKGEQACVLIENLQAELDKKTEALENIERDYRWILRDMSYKAPEQLAGMAMERWLPLLMKSVEQALKGKKLHPNKHGREDCADCPYPERPCCECINRAKT